PSAEAIVGRMRLAGASPAPADSRAARWANARRESNFLFCVFMTSNSLTSAEKQGEAIQFTENRQLDHRRSRIKTVSTIKFAFNRSESSCARATPALDYIAARSGVRFAVSSRVGQGGQFPLA